MEIKVSNRNKSRKMLEKQKNKKTNMYNKMLHWLTLQLYIPPCWIWRSPAKNFLGVIDSYQCSQQDGNNFIILSDRMFVFFLKRILALWYPLHWALYQEYLNIRSLNNLIVRTEFFPSTELPVGRITPSLSIYIYIYKLS